MNAPPATLLLRRFCCSDYGPNLLLAEEKCDDAANLRALCFVRLHHRQSDRSTVVGADLNS